MVKRNDPDSLPYSAPMRPRAPGGRGCRYVKRAQLRADRTGER